MTKKIGSNRIELIINKRKKIICFNLLDNYLQYLGYQAKSKTTKYSVTHNEPPEPYCSIVVK